MKFPKKIKIAGHVYQVLFPYKFRERSDLCGHADHNLLEIRVSDTDSCGNKLPESKLLGIFIHEIIHCISHAWDIGLEETQVLNLEEGFLAFLTNNGFLKT